MPAHRDPAPSRRAFLARTASAAVAAAGPVAAARRPAPSARINLGAIGLNGMGAANLANCAVHPDVQVVALCDVWQARLDRQLAKHPGATGYRDWRELLAHRDLDAVIIATPPHWHALMAITAAQAGKDIYLQKPMTLYPGESLAVRNAVNRHEVICQVGTQIHASANYRRCVEWIRSGQLGPISAVRTFNVMNQGPEGIGKSPPTATPGDLWWDMWCGPAPRREYHPKLAESSYWHCWFMPYSGGWTPGMAPHLIDLPIWALELDLPTAIHSMGGRQIDDDGDAPEQQEIVWQYPGLVLTWSMSTVNSFAWDFGRGSPARRLGIYFHGQRGTLIADYGRCEIVAEGALLTDAAAPPASIPPSTGHEREWLDCIKSRQLPSCHVNYHSRVDLPLTLANLSLRLGRGLRFDPRRQVIVGDDEAVRAAVPEYRRPWKFPVEYLPVAWQQGR
ncbi:MAG: Gfo/Idh/MocA family oxidoreductase [Fimbriimonadaceae bacterium]|nr:Gfo/Idh/MocA family oxidoreductase [Fimbriimonadaceae bacterium]